MAKTIVSCSSPQCHGLATYKIAAPWKDGRFNELKTYGHACAAHLQEALERARERRRHYELGAEETVGEITAYHFEEGLRDSQLKPA